MPGMTYPEMWKMLEENGHDALIATVRPDGRPHCVPVWYTLDEGEIVFSTDINSVKAVNLRSNPRVAVTISQSANPAAFVMIDGLAAFLHAAESEHHRLLEAIFARYGERYEGQVNLNQTAIIRVKVLRMVGENYG